MRPMTRRLGVLCAATTAATVAAVAPATPSTAATTIGVCTSVTSIGWATSGEFSATITASVSGSCLVPGWTSCDIRLSGALGIVTERSADYNSCSASVTLVGLQNTPYVAVGAIGYSAAEAPVHVSGATDIPRR